MLVLSLRKNERVRVGDGYVYGEGKIAFDFPRTVDISRQQKTPGVNHDGGPDRSDGAPSDGWLPREERDGNTEDCCTEEVNSTEGCH